VPAPEKPVRDFIVPVGDCSCCYVALISCRARAGPSRLPSPVVQVFAAWPVRRRRFPAPRELQRLAVVGVSHPCLAAAQVGHWQVSCVAPVAVGHRERAVMPGPNGPSCPARSSNVSTDTPCQTVPSLDHLVTQWMSTVTSWLGVCCWPPRPTESSSGPGPCAESGRPTRPGSPWSGTGPAEPGPRSRLGQDACGGIRAKQGSFLPSSHPARPPPWLRRCSVRAIVPTY